MGQPVGPVSQVRDGVGQCLQPAQSVRDRAD